MKVKILKRERNPKGRSAVAGFSLIEALIAAAILLMIALGLIPLFARSIVDNSLGNDATQASNHGKTHLEELLQLPFSNQRLTVPAASTELAAVDTFTLGNQDQIGDAGEGWWPGAPTDKGRIAWTRTTRVRQYGITDLDDGVLDAGEAKSGGTQPIFIHLKEVEVQMDSSRQSLQADGTRGTNRALTLRVLRPF
jgi:Tfp pilus assembly protein PilV